MISGSARPHCQLPSGIWAGLNGAAMLYGNLLSASAAGLIAALINIFGNSFPTAIALHRQVQVTA